MAGILVMAAVAGAAPQAAELRGQVMDENELPVAGAEVVIRTPAGQSQSAYTDAAGRFVVRALNSGEIRINLSKAGFFRLADQTVQLAEGVNEVSFVLRHEVEIHQTIEVTSSSSRVEPQETAHQRELVAHEIRDIPVPSTHDLKSSLPALPGVVRDNSSQFHIAGARVGQAEVELDGFEVGDPATGDLTFRVNVDSLRAVEVQSGSYGAQYAHAGAGVLALETTAGEDRWRFGVTNFIPGIDFNQGTHLGNWYPRLVFSGPVRKGRVWFSEAASVQHTFKVVSGQPPGADTTTQWAGDNLFRLQANLTPGHILWGSFLYNQAGDSRVGLGPFSPLSTTTDHRSRRAFFSLKDQIWFQNTLFEIGAAGDIGRSESSPQGSGPYFIAPTGTFGSFFEAMRERARRWQLISNVHMPSRRWHGSHDLSAGINADEVIFNQTAVRSAILFLRADGVGFRQATFLGPGQFHLSNTQVGGYAQDSWQAFRALRVQAGLRADWDRLVQRAVVAPRVAVNVLPFRDDRAKLTLAWGIYYQPLDLVLWGQAFDQLRRDVFFDSRGAIPLTQVVNVFTLPPGHLKQPRFYTTSVEWTEKLAGSTLVGIHLLARDAHDGLAYNPQIPVIPVVDFLLQNSRQDRYRAAELLLRHSFREKAEVFADYTRSRARSNQVLDFSLGALPTGSQAPGALAWDAPNRFLSWGWTPLPIWHLWLSYFFEYRTGFPFSVVNQFQQMVGPPNRLRFPDYVSLSVAVEKRFRFHGYEWAARLVVVNLTGHRNPDAVINNLDAPSFLTFAGGQGRAISVRLRLVAQK